MHEKKPSSLSINISSRQLGSVILSDIQPKKKGIKIIYTVQQEPENFSKKVWKNFARDFLRKYQRYVEQV